LKKQFIFSWNLEYTLIRIKPLKFISLSGTSATLKKTTDATAINSSADKRCQNDASSYTKSSLRDFFTVLALSFHAVFEGLAVGLETDSKDVWLLFAAVATHKYVISFCVGLELCNARTRLLIYSAYMIIFAIMSPIGTGIGIIITSNSGTGSTYFLVVAVLQALAGGTIIYVVVFEVLERERSKNVSGLAQLFFVILGFCVLMSVEMLGGHDHNHSHDNEHTNVTIFKPQH
jgi:zinc transporter 1/2/3